VFFRIVLFERFVNVFWLFLFLCLCNKGYNYFFDKGFYGGFEEIG
jgi:hypothetical protein